MKLQKQMLEKGIMIGRAFPSFDDWCRISTGTPHEVIMLNDALKNYILIYSLGCHPGPLTNLPGVAPVGSPFCIT